MILGWEDIPVRAVSYGDQMKYFEWLENFEKWKVFCEEE